MDKVVCEWELKGRAEWEDGKPIGERVEYADGQKSIEGEITPQAVGAWTEYYADGQKSFEGTRKRTIKEKWTKWYELVQNH